MNRDLKQVDGYTYDLEWSPSGFKAPSLQHVSFTPPCLIEYASSFFQGHATQLCAAATHRCMFENAATLDTLLLAHLRTGPVKQVKLQSEACFLRLKFRVAMIAAQCLLCKDGVHATVNSTCDLGAKAAFA